MAISKARKEELVAQYKDLIKQSDAIFLTEYGGMSVKDMQTLRGKLREVGDLQAIGVATKRLKPFVLLDGKRPTYQLPLL